MATYKITGPDGKQYKVTAPEGATQEDLRAFVQQQAAPPELSTGQKVFRGAEMASRGFTDSALETLAALPEAAAWGMRKVGLPAPDPGTYERGMKGGYNALAEALSVPFRDEIAELGPLEPQGAVERGLYGAGRGAADAASIMLPAAGVARASTAGSLTQGVAKALAAQPALQVASGVAGGAVGESTENPYLGLLAALAVPAATSAARRAVTPIGDQLSPEERRLAGVAAREGIPLTPAQKTGSKPLSTLESVFGEMPLTAGPQARVTGEQARTFNKAVLSRAGINADSAAPEVLSANRRRLGDEFTRLSNATVVSLDNVAKAQIADVAKEYGKYLDSLKKPVFQSVVDDIAMYGDSMPGDVYQQARSRLSAMANSGGDGYAKEAFRKLRNTLDDIADRSIPEDLRPAWKQARKEWGAQKTIERAMASSTNAATAGNIPPTGLSQAARTGNREAFARGEGDLNDLARVGTAFVRDSVPNSGTAIRTLIQRLLQGGAFGGGAVALGASPLAVGGAMTAGLVGPRAVQAVYNTPAAQRYLSNTLLKPQPLLSGPLAGILAAQGKEPAVRGLLAP